MTRLSRINNQVPIQNASHGHGQEQVRFRVPLRREIVRVAVKPIPPRRQEPLLPKRHGAKRDPAHVQDTQK